MPGTRPPIRTLTIVIPVYNEQDTIVEVVQQVCAVNLQGLRREVVISNDGSTDGTPAAVADLERRYGPIVRVVASPVNEGKGAAVRRGLSVATGDAIIIQDADLELSPHEYERILAPLCDGRADVVYGSRFLASSDLVPVRTRLANRFLTRLTNLLYGSRLTDMETAYKAFRREVLAGINLRAVRFEIEPEITARFLMAGHTILEVPVRYNPRTLEAGKKIGWTDGLEAIYTLFRCRYFDRP